MSEGTALTYTPKADGAYLAGAGTGAGAQLAEIDIHNPHPEVTWQSLFGKVWYEGSEKPEYVWQSTGGTDDFEPKLSLTPLLVGTLKGTFYSLLLAIPLGVLGAMYTSQFMHPATSGTSSRWSRSWPRCPAWSSASSPACGSRRGSRRRSRPWP